MVEIYEDPDRVSPERVAIGIIATENTTDQVIRSVCRAIKHDFSVLVTHYNTPEIEAVQIAEWLGAQIVHPADDILTEERLRHELAATAREHSFSGIIFQPENGDRINYGRSMTMLAEDDQVFATDAAIKDDAISRVVAIPAYNEARTISSIVREAYDHADIVLVIDDGSADNTAERAREAGAIVIKHERNRGYGAALKTAFVEANHRNAETLVILDSDGQHDPNDIPVLIEALDSSDASLAIGSRFVEGSETRLPPYRRIGLIIVNILTNLSIGAFRSESWIHDTQSGYRAYTQEVIELLATNSIGAHMDASTNILYHVLENGYEITEAGITVDYNLDDTSQHNPVSHGLILVRNILRTIERKHPILALGVPGFISSLIGIGVAYLTITTYINSGTFPLGLALVSSSVMLIGIFACFTAIILHSIHTHYSI